MNLEDIRVEIDRVDREMLRLFEERMKLSAEVAENKKRSGKAIYDPEREKEKLKKLGDMASSEFNRHSVEDLFLQIMSISRKYQYRLLGDSFGNPYEGYTCMNELPVGESAKVAYQGVPGAWSHIAARFAFGADVAYQHVDNFEDLVSAVEQGEVDYGVLPVENSSAGVVHGAYHLLQEHDVQIVKAVRLPIRQALLGIPGAKPENIQRVYSHPQALFQSGKYLEEQGWQQISFANTAISAEKVKKDADRTQAAVGSAYAAELYGLEILNPCINDVMDNTTQFMILAKGNFYTEDADHITISFTLPHASGTLYQILGHFIFNDLNMTAISSEPIPEKQWEYRFYITFQGNLMQDAVRNALNGVMQESAQFKFMGNYKLITEA